MIDFLINSVNKQENLTELLKLFIDITKSKGCSIFLIENSEIKYKCLRHLCIINPNSISVKFEPLKPLNDIFISNNLNNLGGYISECPINKIMIIPITNPSKVGAIILVNSDIDYNESLITELTPYISLAQIILQKEKLLQDFKKLETFNLTGESRDLFLANISHEIRTPLNGIIGYSQLLSQTSLNTIQKNYIMSMNQCGLQLMKIINDILDFSKLSYGKMSINSDCFDIKEIIETVKDTIKNKILEKRQQLNVNIDPYIPENIITDKQKLLQILINLISNANKFTDMMGTIDINIKYLSSLELEISVKDNGIGISEEDQCKLFNSFIQVNNAKIKNGTGLGLYITKKLVELLGGSINVSSYPMHGSTFTFTIKIKTYIDFEKQIKHDDVLLKDKYILIVDDNADNRILLSEILFEWEMKPIVCASALEALRMVLCNRYNFVIGLIDICMPGITGIDLAKQIKEEHPFFPMIALSSIDSFITSPEFECKLDKPINKVRLYNSIRSILNKNKYPVGYLGSSKTETIIEIKSNNNIKNNNNVRILIAEDIIYNSTMLVNMLENLNYKYISIAKDGKETIEIIEKEYKNNNTYHILLLDLIMPLMNGYDVIEVIKKKGWNIIIIVVTASVIEEDVQKCKNLGIKYFINKPIDMKQLRELLIYAINTELNF
jgi:signal transduction histidine kinase/DNA-binding response OmpR family regulator